PEVHCHLYSFELVQLQVVMTAPEGQLINLPSVCKSLPPVMSFRWTNTSPSKDFMTTDVRVTDLWSLTPVIQFLLGDPGAFEAGEDFT
ncbi:hypothetical protein DVA76_18760, partial [Acinetobacter baumannii]